MTKEQIKLKFNTQKTTHLIISIIIDLIGMATYLLPVIGELIDFIWAPISGIAIFIMYRQNRAVGILGGLFGTAEEVLFGDFIPTATLLWLYTYQINGTKTYNDYTLKHSLK